MNTKKFICDTMLELIKEKDFDKITVQNILNRAQISRSTFYSYFENKYNVISWYCHEQARQMQEGFREPSWYELTLRLNKFASKNRFFFKSMYEKDSSQSYFSYEEKYMYDFLAQSYIKKHKLKKLTPQQHITILFAVRGNLSAIREWILKDLPFSYREISDITFKLLPTEIRECL